MGIVERTADAAVDPPTDRDGDDSLPPIADYDNGGAGGPQGTDDVGPCPRRLREDPGDPAAPLFPPSRRRRSFPGTPMGLRETARYGLRAARLGKASHPGLPTLGTGSMSYRLPGLLRGWLTLTIWFLLCARSTRPFRLRGLALSGPTLQVFQRGGHRQSHRRRLPGLRLPLLAMPAQPIASLLRRGGTSHRTSHTIASSFSARLRGEAGAGTGDGHVTPPAAYGSSGGSDRSPNPSSLSGGVSFVAGDSGPGLVDPRTGPDPWLGPDPGVGRVCGCMPGVPFTPPCIRFPYCDGPGAVPDTPPSPYDPWPVSPAAWVGPQFQWPIGPHSGIGRRGMRRTDWTSLWNRAGGGFGLTSPLLTL